MKKPLLLLFALALALAGAAAAQQYKWVDKDGKVRYGDAPPPGVKATPLKPPPAGPAPAPAAKGTDKEAQKGPLTPAQQEADYRRRQQEAAKAKEKSDQEAQLAKQKREACDNARDNLRVLESGQRIARTDAQGERFFLEDDQRQAEIVRARKSISEACS